MFSPFRELPELRNVAAINDKRTYHFVHFSAESVVVIGDSRGMSGRSDKSGKSTVRKTKHAIVVVN